MLKDIVFDQLKQAMKNKDVLAKGVLQLVKAALENAEKEKGAPLSEQEEIAVIEKETAKLQLLKSFLPEQLSEEAIAEKLSAAGISSDTSMGEAMKIAKSLLDGQADGATLSKVVKQLITK